MKLTALLLTITLVQAHGAGIAQNVSISGENLTLKKVFAEIKRQTGYAFFYNYSLLKQAHPVSLNVKDEPLTKVLDRCFSDQPLDYYLENKTIVITKKAPPATDSTDRQPAAGMVVIKGKVVDERGEPIPAASVHLRNAKVGTSTGADGSFILRVPEGSVVVISCVGYLTKTITATRDETLMITLAISSKAIDEVVVTGFGESREKRSLGYSVTQISGDDLRNTAEVNPISAMQGMVAGLQIQPGVAGEASTPQIKLRGSNSLNAYENFPLVVVDGMIYDESSVTENVGTSTDFGNILKDIAPDDIESISVLKGGAVTALYGSKALNGVLFIKTKKGRAQKGVGVTFSQEAMFDQAYKTVDFQNTYGGGYWSTDWSATPTGGLEFDAGDYGASFGPKMAGQPFLDITGQTRADLPNKRDVVDLYRIGQTSNTNVSLNTGDDKSTFRMSWSRLGSTTVLPDNSFDRESFVLRGTHKIGSAVNVDGNVTFVHSYNLNPAQQSGSSPMYQMLYDGWRNYDANYWSHHYIGSAGGVNTNDISGLSDIIFFPLYQDKYFQKENNLRAGFDMTAQILPWLSFDGNANINLYDKDYEADTRGTNPGFASPNYSKTITDLIQAQYRAEFAATKTYGNYRMDLHLGGTVWTSQQDGAQYSLNGGGVLPDVYRLSNSVSAPNITEDPPNKNELYSLYGQGSIGYKNFLTLNIYGREDWNSTLVYSDGHGTYGYFYGGADAAFVFTDLWKARPSLLDYGKLRLSYASTGAGTDPYTANAGYYETNGYYTGSTTAASVTTYHYSSTELPNANLIPERASKLEAGLELQFFHHRLGADVAVYNQQTNNQIIDFTVPITSGVQTALLNGGLVVDRGVEVSVNGTPIQHHNFNWNSKIIYYYNRNTVRNVPFGQSYLPLYGEDGIQSIAQANGPYGELAASYGYAQYAGGQGNKMNGQRVLAMMGNGTQAYYVRATNYGSTPQTQEPVVGKTNPWLLGSWTNTFQYKNFSLNIMLDARFGGMEWSTSYFYGTQAGNIKSSLFGRDAAHHGVAFTPADAQSQYTGIPLGTGARNDGIELKGVFEPNSTSVGTDGASHDVSGMTYAQAYKNGYVLPVNSFDYYIETFGWAAGIRQAGDFENSWVALRGVNIGYDFPSGMVHHLKLNNLRVSLVGRNLLYLFNSAHDHINPENENDSGSGSAFEDGGVPYVRSYGLQLNTNF